MDIKSIIEVLGIYYLPGKCWGGGGVNGFAFLPAEQWWHILVDRVKDSLSVLILRT